MALSLMVRVHQVVTVAWVPELYWRRFEIARDSSLSNSLLLRMRLYFKRFVVHEPG